MTTKYEIVTWPEVQDLMSFNDFNKHACLANDDYFVEKYGSSAYFVDSEWMEVIYRDINEDLIADYMIDQAKSFPKDE